MKVKKITIAGMHKVARKSYTFNDGITYFVGENGAGKSTILEAIQLALLGYIPGYAKTNESVMKHAAGPAMSIEAELEDGIKITRTWTRSGSSVQSNVDVSGFDGEISDLIGNIALPVFDFNEFKSMTANKLKDWFITFLPDSGDGLDIRKELEGAVEGRSLNYDELLDEVDEWVENSGLAGLELVRQLNAKFKEDQSFTKGQVAKLQGTLQSLVKYDDAEDLDEESIRKEMDDLSYLKFELMKSQASADARQKAQAAVDALKKDLGADIFENDEKVKNLKSQLESLMKQKEVLEADYRDIQEQIQELRAERATIPSAGSTCPYTGESCETASKLAETARGKLSEIDEKIKFKEEELKDCDSSVQSKLDYEIMRVQAELGGIQSQYDRLIAAQLQLDNTKEAEVKSDMTVDEINMKISDLQNKLVQVQANKKYDELYEKVTADKFKLENDLELYKLWIKKTDANGLQTQLMDTPFENLAGDMSEYLSQMFNNKTMARFNLVAKANSFSFGLDRDGGYIEFDYLSSGERCLFTLALMMCILNKSQSSIRTILIDDILDHLDSSNASYLFKALKGVEDIQFILAGVKECEDSSICSPV